MRQIYTIKCLPKKLRHLHRRRWFERRAGGGGTAPNPKPRWAPKKCWGHSWGNTGTKQPMRSKVTENHPASPTHPCAQPCPWLQSPGPESLSMQTAQDAHAVHSRTQHPAHLAVLVSAGTAAPHSTAGTLHRTAQL